MQADNTMSSHKLDEEMVNETVRMGFERSMVVESIRKRQQNKATVAYYLMFDNRRRLPSSGYLSAELTEAAAAAAVAHVQAGFSSQGGAELRRLLPSPQDELVDELSVARMLNHPSNVQHYPRIGTFVSLLKAPSFSPSPPAGLMSLAQMGSSQALTQQRLVAERKWRLGSHGRGHASTIMAELFRVLQLNQVSWKKVAPYNIKCRRVVTVQPNR